MVILIACGLHNFRISQKSYSILICIMSQVQIKNVSTDLTATFIASVPEHAPLAQAYYLKESLNKI